MAEFGICYVADSDAFIDEAMVSIASLRKHMPDVPVALATHPHLFRDDPRVTDWVALRDGRAGPVLKSESWHAPYERVLFIDTDTLILRDLTGVFALLDKFDIATTVEPNGRPDRGLEAGVPLTFPELNNAFMAYRKTPEVRRFFDVWLAEFDSLRETRNVTANQPAFRIALWKCDWIRYVTLGHEYNLLLHACCSVADEVAVLHDRTPGREWVAKVVNRRLGPRAVVPGFGPIGATFSRLGWIRQFARLSWRFLVVLMRPKQFHEQKFHTIWWDDEIDCRQWPS